MKPLRIHSEARAELDEAIAYYERQKKGLGLDFEDVIRQAFRNLRANPYLGAPYKSTELRHYVVQRFPYVILYADLGDTLWVVAVAHAKRRPDYWKGRRME